MPEAAGTWKPHPISRSAGELARHVASGFHWFASDPLTLKVPPKPAAPPVTPAAVVEAVDAMTRDGPAALKEKDDARVRAPAVFLGRATTNGGILEMRLIHEAQHRGPICGPRADREKAAGASGTAPQDGAAGLGPRFPTPGDAGRAGGGEARSGMSETQNP